MAAKISNFSPAVDAYIAKSAAFAQPILTHLRELVHEAVPDVQEEIKWSMPFFVHKDVILGNMSAFKQHCAFGLWGTEVSKTLRKEGTGAGGSMGSFGRITSLQDLPPRKRLLSYAKAAAKLIDEGARTKAWERPRVAKPEPVVPEALVAALKQDKAAGKKFESMTPGCRREYCDWIASAKRDATRDERVQTAVVWIAEGKKRNWKYESC